MIKVDNVSMCYNLGREKINSLKEMIIKKLKGQLQFEQFYALKNIDFQIEKGDVLGVIGTNGAGKSTLLKLIAGILKPTVGKITVMGTVAPIIELGAGFDVELTARENIFLNGAVLGYTKRFIESKLDEIIKFSELQDFMDIPIRNYSSGMVARLAFSIATVVNPEILIIDEVLAVGDLPFQRKSYNKIREIMDGGTTVIYVSHAIETVEALCTKVLWLNKGTMMMFGDVAEVCEKYKDFCNH